MLIKVCGMRDAENIREVSALGVDIMGFIFYPKSPRYVAQIPTFAGIIPDVSEASLSKAQPYFKKVGVFVDDMPQNIITRVYNYNLDYIQLHGEETVTMIDNLRATIDPDIHKGIKFIKAISVSSADDVKKYKEYEGHVELFLFDTKCKMVGGSGDKFDWNVLNGYDGDTPFILSGGIGPDDVERIKAFKNPKCVGIDLNSCFETSPAMKDIEKLRTFISEINR